MSSHPDCHLPFTGENLEAYQDESNPIGLGEFGIYIPDEDLNGILQWALLNRCASSNGFYDLDLLLVPLTGEPLTDYTDRSFVVGDQWKMNLAALS